MESSTEHSPEFHIRVNLASISSRVAQVAKKASYMVAIGHHASENLNAKALETPPESFFDFGHKEAPLTPEAIKPIWLNWLLVNAFRDVAEALAGTLEEVHQVLAMWRFKGTHNESAPVKLSDWNAEVVAKQERFHRAGLPEKLEKLEKDFGLTLDPTLLASITSINAVRNCLVHRNGVVGTKDADETGSLTLRWRTLKMQIREAGDQWKDFEMPYTTKSEAELAVQAVDRTKLFALGQSIAISTTEFSAICWTHFLFADHAAKQLEEHGRGIGIKFEVAGATEGSRSKP